MTLSEIVGVDGCKGGWFSVGIDRTGGFEMKLFCSFRKLLDYYGGAKLILVDIPIGLPEGKDGRDCDRTVGGCLAASKVERLPDTDSSSCPPLRRKPDGWQDRLNARRQ